MAGMLLGAHEEDNVEEPGSGGLKHGSHYACTFTVVLLLVPYCRLVALAIAVEWMAGLKASANDPAYLIADKNIETKKSFAPRHQ